MKQLALLIILLCIPIVARAQGAAVAVRTVTTLSSGAGACQSKTTYTEMVFKSASDATRGFYTCKETQDGWNGPYAQSGGSGTIVTTTGTPASGNLTKFSAPATVTNGDLSGDVSTSGTLVTTLASVISAGGPTGSATVAPIITYDAKGRLTTVSSATITPAVGSITGLGTGVATALAVNVGTAGAFLTKPASLTTDVTGTLPAGNGGTGITSLGTGVATALGNAVNASGGFVKFSGDLGTPTSGTVTNLTGTASININGTVGATTPTTGAFTTTVHNDVATFNTPAAGVPAKFIGRTADDVSVVQFFKHDGTTSEGDILTLGTSITLRDGSAGNQLTWSTAGVALPSIAADTAQTDSTVCQATGTHILYSGTGAAGLCLGTSSLQFKRDISPLAMGLKEINALNPVSFHYLKGYGDSGARPQVGYIAEDVYKSTPSLVGLDKAGKPQTVDYMGVMVVATNAIKELSAKVDAQQAEIIKLRRQVRQLRSRR